MTFGPFPIFFVERLRMILREHNADLKIYSSEEAHQKFRDEVRSRPAYAAERTEMVPDLLYVDIEPKYLLLVKGELEKMGATVVERDFDPGFEDADKEWDEQVKNSERELNMKLIKWLAIIFTATVFFVAFFIALDAFAVPRVLYKTPENCEFLLTSDVHLSDLLAMGVVEQESPYLHAPPEHVDAHELKTATILAERLKQPVALIPRLTRSASIPAVDGILFDQMGAPTKNFSLKTFMPNQTPGSNLNDKLRAIIRAARRSVEDNYSVARWNEVIKRGLPGNSKPQECDLECRTYAKIFGLSENKVRPVTVVIDYTQDATAIFRVKFQVRGFEKPRAFLTLTDDTGEGINLMSLMDTLHSHPTVSEYIFLGAHHLVRVDQFGVQMTEFCDHVGHAH